MKHPQTGICREGCPFLALVAFSALLFALLGLWLPALAFLLVLWLSSHFFRDPERVCPQEGHCALRGCPACFLILKGVVISSHETNRFS